MMATTSVVVDRVIAATDHIDAPGRRHGAVLQLMGGFGLTVDGVRIALTDSSQRLLGLLALSPTPLDRRLVACRLWPDKTDDRAAANLRSTLWRLPTLDGRTPDDAALVSTHGSRIGLSDEVDVDVRALERCGWELVAEPQQWCSDIDRSQFFAELLPSWYDDWVLLERERLAQLQLHFVEALAYELLRREATAAALDTALRLVAVDPLRERSQRVLLTVYCAEGSLGQAQRQLDRYRAQLDEAFGCRPALSIGRILLDLESRRQR